MQPPSFEAVMQKLVDLKTEEVDKVWEQSGLMTLLVQRYNVKPGDIAETLGCSSALVREYVRTFSAFPVEDDRAKDLTHYHHRLASKAEEPSYWIQKALEEGWSTRQLQQAMAGKEEEKDPLDKVRKLWGKVLEEIEQGGKPGAWLTQQVHELGMSL